MWLILCLALFFSSGDAAAVAAMGQIELFDSDAQKVVAAFDNTAELQAEAQRIMDSVSGRVQEFNPSLDHVTVLKIPLVPPKRLSLRSAGLDVEITDMFVVMPKQGRRQSWLILHTKQYETVVVEFSRDVKKLKELLPLP